VLLRHPLDAGFAGADRFGLVARALEHGPQREPRAWAGRGTELGAGDPRSPPSEL